ncbi:MAG: alpha/beta fold hydrolase, partial [Alphaproteobacteria bacterium]|nr:alpha/beta fold hydrolase [Alphaproteobacteria bacterium]
MTASAARRLPPLVLIHGVGLDRTMWDGVLDCLSGRLRCTAFDMPCHGEAGMPAGEVTLRTFSDALGSVVNGLDGAPVVAGFSMGAMVAQRFALDRPDAL